MKWRVGSDRLVVCRQASQREGISFCFASSICFKISSQIRFLPSIFMSRSSNSLFFMKNFTFLWIYMQSLSFTSRAPCSALSSQYYCSSNFSSSLQHFESLYCTFVRIVAKKLHILSFLEIVLPLVLLFINSSASRKLSIALGLFYSFRYRRPKQKQFSSIRQFSLFFRFSYFGNFFSSSRNCSVKASSFWNLFFQFLKSVPDPSISKMQNSSLFRASILTIKNFSQNISSWTGLQKDRHSAINEQVF